MPVDHKKYGMQVINYSISFIFFQMKNTTHVKYNTFI